MRQANYHNAVDEQRKWSRELTEPVGTQLWRMRTEKGLSLSKLAQQAGVSKMTLSRWEAGTRQPAVTELESVLDALGATAAQHALIFARIDAPRAVRRLREHQDTVELPLPPTLGDLLRAMRLRRGWAQEQVAAKLGVNRSSIARWERGERLPDSEQIQALCYVLGAHEEELLTLTRRQFIQTPRWEPTDWKEKEAELLQRLQASWEMPDTASRELYLLMIEREAWEWAAREPAAQNTLAMICLQHGHYQRLEERWEASRSLLDKAWKLISRHPNDPTVLSRAVILRAVLAVYGGNRPAPERGVSLLREWAGRPELPPDYIAWMLSDMAEYLVMTGQNETGLQLAEKACRLVEHHKPREHYLRRLDYGLQLIKAEQPAEALSVLPNPPDEPSVQRAQGLFILAAAYRAAGSLSEAHDCIGEVLPLIDILPKRLQAKIAELSAQF